MFRNAGTLICLRVGARDAEWLAAELGMANPAALRETSNFHAWLRLMHRDIPREARLIRTSPPQPPGQRFARVLAQSRARHMRPRAAIEARIDAQLAAPTRRIRKGARRNPDR